MIKLKLSDDQLKALDPLFSEVETMNAQLRDAGIVAQIWRDGMVVALMKDERALALADALGGRGAHSSAKERFSS